MESEKVSTWASDDIYDDTNRCNFTLEDAV